VESLAAENAALRRRVAELEAAEEKVGKVFQADPDAFYLAQFDDGTLIHCSNEFLNIFGYAPEELHARTALEGRLFADPTDRDRVLALLEEHGSFRDLELRGRRKNGDIFHAALSASALQIGGVAHILGVVRDITERKRAEEALRESEEKYRTLVETTATGFVILDAEGRVLDANQEYARLTGGQGISEVLGRSVLEWTAPHDRARTATELARCLAQGCVRCLELDYVTPAGLTIPVELNATALPTPDGARILAISRDITDRRQALEETHKLAAVVRHAAELVNLATLDGRMTFLNEAGRRMLGIAPADVSRTHIMQVIPEHLRELAEREVFPTLAAGRAWEGDLQYLNLTTGQTTDVYATVFTVNDQKTGKPLYLANVSNDITRRKRVEETLRELDRRKTGFLAMLSHELRNPLAPIHNSIYILERAAPGGEQARRALAVIDRQVGHMTRLIDDLLDTTRIVSGKVQLKRERLDLNDVVRRTIEDHRSVFVESGVHLEVLLPTEVLWLSGDATRLAQVVGNLLQNAVKFTPPGGKTTVSVEVDVSRTQAVLTVRDTGSGIAPEIMPRLFEAFVQADASIDRSKGGLGLGLALVKSMVEMHGGVVSVASDGLGKGATFTLRLPLETASTESTADRCGAGSAGSSRRILIIEDNVDAADSLREALELGGHVVVAAYDGPTGIERARALRPDLVLCDLGLPEMDGYAVARAIRADPEIGGITLVAVTGYAEPEDVTRAKEAGFDAHVAKPPSFETLERVAAQAVGPRR